MGAKVGLPQALLYYRYHSAWQTFFTALDCEVVEASGPTDQVVNDAVKLANDEACFPVKLFLGHVENLKDKVDYLFVPRMVSVNSDEYLCPKFMGLPDVVRYNISDLPPLIDVTVNLRDNKLNLIKTAVEIGKKLDKGYWQVMKAAWKAWQAHKAHYKKMREKTTETDYKVGLLGHEYIIHDDQLSMDLIDNLQDRGLGVITANMLTDNQIQAGLAEETKDMFWTFNKQMLGAAYHFFHRTDIDGIIQLTAFGCGPDSLVGEMIEREAKHQEQQPFMLLNLDEHTGEAGLITRVEAFADMIQWEGV